VTCAQQIRIDGPLILCTNERSTNEPKRPAEPFLRWAGGKRQLIPELMRSLPSDIAGRRYIEPFLGAGSLYFSVAPKRALVADANPFLIGAYKALRDYPDVVLKNLRNHIALHSESYYYQIRAEYNQLRHSAEQAARFIYLNRSCFNGIFRVNAKNEFNVPKGSKTKLQVPLVEEYMAIARSPSPPPPAPSPPPPSPSRFTELPGKSFLEKLQIKGVRTDRSRSSPRFMESRSSKVG
jgi:hypothetical protein